MLSSQTLALEQSQPTLKAGAFKVFSFVQYALSSSYCNNTVHAWRCCPMNIELTQQQFRYLLDLVYIGNWVINSTR